MATVIDGAAEVSEFLKKLKDFRRPQARAAFNAAEVPSARPGEFVLAFAYSTLRILAGAQRRCGEMADATDLKSVGP
jgi:hypothetical protein